MSKKLSIFMTVLMVFSLFQATGLTVSAANNGASDIQLEDLDRGLVATSTSEGVFLSWRLLADEVTAYSDYGLRGTDFNVYRNGEKIATVTSSTNYLDEDGTNDSEYYVSAVVDGEETGNQSEAVTPWAQSHYDLPLQKPEDGVTPAGEAYSYHAIDMSVGDVTGDGQYEYIVKWEPTNSKDVSQKGYTGKTYIDTYTFDGELLYRIDLGVNIRSGAHYTQFLVYDFDGNGKSELMFKTAPGTKVIHYNESGEVTSEEYITMPQEDLDAGYSNEDDYRMSPDDYYNHVVEMFMNWHEHEEVVAGDWPATLEESFGIEPEYSYPLSREDAESLADYFMDEYAPSRSGRNDLRNFEGFILEGPEYITAFNGETGAEMDTVHYKPGRQDDGLLWGDYAMSRIEPGNRVDRFLAGVAYLDGQNPYAVFARGYYTRAAIVSYTFDGKNIEENWVADSGWTPMSNPFNDGPHGVLGENEAYATLTTQGNHQFSTADVDGDGKHEIVYGAATIDHDGSLLYSSREELPEGSGNPGAEAGFGHGDALHVADIDPEREGLEIFSVFEGGPWAPYGYALRDAATGEVIYGEYTGKDTGRGMIGDVNRGKRGLETWAVDLRTADGELIGTSRPGTNMNIKWAADMTTQLVNGSSGAPTIDDWENGTMLTAEGTRTNNGTKGNPSLVADVFGDWREELLVRTEDSSAIRIYINDEVTDRKLHTLMHDVQYRTGISWQNSGYNQPAYTSYYFGSDMDWSKVDVPNAGQLEYVEEEGKEIDVTELEELIDSAKAISNENETYTEVTYQALQEAIVAAEESEIKFESDLYTALEALQEAIDGLIEVIDLGPGWRFDFGSENSPVANGYERVSEVMNYDAERGYGFKDGTDGFRDQEGPNDLLRDFILAYNKEFQVDVPDGEYDVRIITGSEWNSNTSTYTLEGGETKGGEGTSAGEFVEYTDTVTVEDGQLNIYFSGEWARINAVEIVAVEDFNVKFDFGSEESPVKYGYEQVANTLVYDGELGYGLDKAVDTRDRGVSDDIRRDFVIGGDYQFMVDLRNGTYDVKIIAGDGIASNKSAYVIEGVDQGRLSSGKGEFSELETTVTVTDGQMNIAISENGRINGLEIYYAGEAVNVDLTPLETLITDAKDITNEDASYTEETFAALQNAIGVAETALETIDSEEALVEAVTALQTAIDGLEEVPELDVTALEELIESAKSLSNGDGVYTEESFAELKTAIETAEAALGTVDSESALTEAVTALQTAVDGLKEVQEPEAPELDVTALEELIESAKALSNEDGAYTEESFAGLGTAIETAEAALETINTETDLTEAVAALQTAIDGLEEVLVEEGNVVSVPTIEDGQAIVADEDIARLVEGGQFTVDVSDIENSEAINTIHFTSEQVGELVNKNATVKMNKKAVSITVPSLHLVGEQAATIAMELQSTDGISIPSDKSLKGDIYKFTITQDKVVSEFGEENPVILEFLVDESKVTDAKNLKLFYLNEDTNEWTEIGGDYSEGVLQATTSHFSIFAPMETAVENNEEEPVEEEPTTDNPDTEVPEEEKPATEDPKNENPTTDDSGQEKGQSDEKDEELPDTATSTYNMLLIGFVLLLLGTISFFVVKRFRRE